MSIICPNLSNPDVARDFNELVEATSEKAAYAIWSLNNGNAIDKAPNGAQSKLFEDLFNYFDGDRVKAIRAKANTFSKPFMDWFGDWTAEDKEHVSKIVDENGEPFVVYHNTRAQFDEFDKKYIRTADGFFFTIDNTPMKAFGDRQIPVYLNVKNLKETDSTMPTGDDFDYQNDGFDGMQYFFMDSESFIVPNPNQIKSINNDGTFTDGNNIYHNLQGTSVENTQDVIDILSRLLTREVGFRPSRAKDSSNVYYSRTSITKTDAEKKLSALLSLFGLPENSANISQYGNIHWNKTIISAYIDDIKDVIQHSKDNSLEEKQALAWFLIDKFKHFKGIKFKSLKGENGHFENGWVVLNRDASLDVAAEECLHPFVAALKAENPELFNQLLKEAKKDFKTLHLEIQDRYGNKKGQDVELELVTQALSRHFADLWETPVNQETGQKDKSIWVKALEYILDLFGLNYLNEIDKTTTLRELAEAIYKAENINISKVYFEDKKYFNLSQQSQNDLDNSIIRQLYDISTNLNAERQQYIQNVLSQYKQNNQNISQQDESRILTKARIQFDNSRANQIMQQHQINLAQTFGLSMNVNGFFESSETSQKKLMLEHFINSLQDSTFKAYSLENINRTKYQQVGSVQNATSVSNILYNAIYNGDITTLDEQLARDYVRMFWTSPLIQAALESFDKKDSKAAEDALVNRMTKEPIESRDTSIIDWFRNFWQQLNSLVHQIFGVHTFTDQQKEDILKAVDAAFMVSEDLELANESSIILDRLDGDFSTSNLLSEKDKQILSDIYKGTKTRVRSQQARSTQNVKLIADLKSRLEIIDGKNQDSIDDVFGIIEDFLVFANQELGQTRHLIDHTFLSNPDISSWNAQEINFIQQDLIGHYDNLLSNIFELFSDKKSAINKYNEHRVQSDPNAIDLGNLTSQLIRSVESIKKDYNQSIIKPYVRKVLQDFVNEQDSITDKKTFIYNMERWLEQDQSYGDLAAGEVLIGMASRSKSPIVRIVEKMISEAEFETNREVLKKGNELVRLYNKIRPFGSQVSIYNWQKRFMELDRDGLPTGYFIREINEGLFFKDKDEYEAQLRSEFNLTADENGHTIFNEEDFTKDDSVYNKYHDKLDEWLDKRCNRRYTLDYYKARRRFLSPKTIQAQNRIQRQIDLILDKCRMESGLVDLSKLTVNEKHRLEEYRKQKRDLGSHYIFTYASDGILRVEEKTGDALKMADEISQWNRYLTDKVKYKPDWTAFNKAVSDLQAQGATQDEIDAFKRNNTVMRITPEFYDLLHKVVGKAATSDKLEALKARHREIINALKSRQGAGRHDLSKLGSGLSTDQSGWKELHRIEQEMADEKRRLKAANVHGEAREIENMTFSEIAKMIYVPVSDTDSRSFLTTLIDQWRSATVSNTNLTNVFNELFTYTDESGKTRYLKAFEYLTPLKWTIKIEDEEINTIESLPGSEYSELDESSPFVNNNFKKNGKSLQVKDVYRNEDYFKLTADEKQFLQQLLNTMQEANDKIPSKSLNLDGRLPQISGRTMSVLSNTLRAKEWSTALKYPFRKFGVKYSETDTDVTTNMDLARRPDGSVVNNIPIRFVEKLPNSSVQTTDVLGSVIAYFDMACNYANKSKNLSTLELIKYAVDPSQSKTGNKMNEQYEKIENLLDQRYYGKETSFGFNSEEKITPAKQRTIQATKTIRNLAAISMLGVNFTTIEVGYIDALCSMIADAIGGKYITGADMRHAFAQCIVHTGKMLKNLGNPVVEDKLVAAMQFNQLSKSNSEIFAMTDKFKIDRFVHEHLLMGGYTLADYMINSMMLTATYNHYKLVTNPDTGKQQFMSKTDAINIFTALGYTEKQAIKQWKKSDTTLWDAYELKDGLFVRKDKYKDIITKKLEDQIAGRLRDRTAIYNGIIPMTEKAKMQQNVFGSFITLMRNFYINTYWDRFKTGGDYVTEEGDHHISWYSEYKRDDLGLVNLETGEFEGAVFKDFIRGMYKLISNMRYLFRSGQVNKLSEPQQYAVKRCLSELGMITSLLFLMLWSVAFARTNNYDDDKDPAWLVNIAGIMPWTDEKLISFNSNDVSLKFNDFLRWKLALLATRGFTERLTSWWAPTVLELFTSPSTAKSYIDDIGTIWDLAFDLFSQRGDEEIKTGGYKHMTRLTRDILKLLSAFGVDTLVKQWHTDGIKSTFNYYRKLTPTSALVPSQEEWNEAHGLGKHGGSQRTSNKKKKVKNPYGY